MGTQAELLTAQKAEYDALLARVEALENAVFETDTEEPPPEDDEQPVATSKSKRTPPPEDDDEPVSKGKHHA